MLLTTAKSVLTAMLALSIVALCDGLLTHHHAARAQQGQVTALKRDKPEPKYRTGNAALKYWQAFAVVSTLDETQESLLKDWKTLPLDAATMRVLNQAQMSLTYLRRGAKSPYCEWGQDLDDGPSLLQPHVYRAVVLARVAAMNARHEFEQRHWTAGLEDVEAIMALARHVGSDHQAVALLGRYEIEMIGIEVLAPYLPELTLAFPKAMNALSQTAAASPTVREMVLAEKKHFVEEWLIKRLVEAQRANNGKWQDVFKELGGGNDLLKSVDTNEKAVRLAKDLLPVYDRLSVVVSLPKHEFDAQYREFRKATVANPLAGLLPTVETLVDAHARNRAQLALFKAAVAVAQGGPGMLKEIPDPFGNKAFGYRALDKGFELRSSLFYREWPVTLTVGPEANRPPTMIGMPAPAWRKTDLIGKLHALEDFRGKVVVLEFWNRNCPPCMNALPQIEQLAKDYKNEPVVVVSMCTNRDDKDARFVVEKLKLTVPVLSATQDVAWKYKVDSVPTVIVIDRAGKVHAVHVGASPTLGAEVGTTVTLLLKSTKRP